MHASLILKKEKSCQDNYCICCAAVVASRQIVAQHLMTVVGSRQIVAQDLKAVVASRQIVAQDLKAVVAWQATTNYCICAGCVKIPYSSYIFNTVVVVACVIFISGFSRCRGYWV